MSVESAREAVLGAAGEWCGGNGETASMNAALDILITAVKSEMPCYTQWVEFADKFDATGVIVIGCRYDHLCPSCTARKELAVMV